MSKAKFNHQSRWHNKENSSADNTKVKDEDVMITTSIKELEAMLEGVETHTKTTFEKMFAPALLIFSLIIIGFFIVIYSITTDMERLAKAMDPEMGAHMTQMATSIDKLSDTIVEMSNNVAHMNNTFSSVDAHMAKVVLKLENLDLMENSIARIQIQLDTLTPMLNNMEHMNASMKEMKESIQRMDQNIFMLRDSFQGPMNKINSLPFM